MNPSPSTEDWTQLHGVPSVSKRVSIAWPPFPAFEDSDVLVLSSRSTLPDSLLIGNTVLYLDLRFTLPPPTSKITWAFAGLRHTIPLTEKDRDDSAVVRYRWEHTIDSHGSGEPPDEGTIVIKIGKDGSETEVENGMGLAPKTGKLGPYEEIWMCVCLVVFLDVIPPDTVFEGMKPCVLIRSSYSSSLVQAQVHQRSSWQWLGCMHWL